MHLHVLPAGPIRTNAYLLTAPELGQAVLIDAPEAVWVDVKPLLARDNVKLVELWLTHGHWDHMQGAAQIVRETGATVRAHRDDQPLIETPEIVERFLGGGIKLEAVKVDAWIQPVETWPILGTTVEVRHVPGHCPGNVLFYFAGAKAAFVGDALFAGSVGRTDLPGGSSEQLAAAIRSQIYTLPDETTVYPGHGPATTVAREKASNPFVRA